MKMQGHFYTEGVVIGSMWQLKDELERAERLFFMCEHARSEQEKLQENPVLRFGGPVLLLIAFEFVRIGLDLHSRLHYGAALLTVLIWLACIVRPKVEAHYSADGAISHFFRSSLGRPILAEIYDASNRNISASWKLYRLLQKGLEEASDDMRLIKTSEALLPKIKTDRSFYVRADLIFANEDEGFIVGVNRHGEKTDAYVIYPYDPKTGELLTDKVVNHLSLED